MTGARALMETLRAEGVKYIFGNPGTSETPIMDELEAHPDLKYILVMQEGVAMGMADAYARASGRTSFVNLHIETGLANGMSLLYNAYFGGTPLVLSAGNKDIRELAHERTDLAEMVRPFTKWTGDATHPEQLPGLVRRAFNEARTPPTGPTFVGFSANALDGEADVDIVPPSDGYSRPTPDAHAVEAAAAILAAATTPILAVADRVAQSGASEEVVRLAEVLGARVYSTYYSEVNFPTGHPQYAGPIRLGFPDTKELLSRGDVVLMVGKLSTSFYMYSDPETRFVGPGTKLIHVDWDPQNVGKSQPTDVGIIADPKVALGELTEAVEDRMSGAEREAAKGRAASLAAERAARKASSEKLVKQKWDDRPMSPERMMAEVAGALPTDFVLADDAVTTRAAYQHTLEFDRPGSVIGMRGGALGWGMGAAMGLKLAHPDRPVVAIVGDGSAMMTVQALWTAAVENIPVIYVICNNGSYRILKQGMHTYKKLIRHDQSATSRYLGMDFQQPLNIAGMAEAMGVHGRRIEDPEDLGGAIRSALDLGKPAVLDVVIDGSV